MKEYLIVFINLFYIKRITTNVQNQTVTPNILTLLNLHFHIIFLHFLIFTFLLISNLITPSPFMHALSLDIFAYMCLIYLSAQPQHNCRPVLCPHYPAIYSCPSIIKFNIIPSTWSHPLSVSVALNLLDLYYPIIVCVYNSCSALILYIYIYIYMCFP